MARRQSQSEDERIAEVFRNICDGGVSERTKIDAIKMYLMSVELHNTSNVFSYPEALNPLADADEVTYSPANPTDAKTQGAQTERENDQESTIKDARQRVLQQYKYIKNVISHSGEIKDNGEMHAQTSEGIKIVTLDDLKELIDLIPSVVKFYEGERKYFFDNNKDLKGLAAIKKKSAELISIYNSIIQVVRQRQSRRTQGPSVHMDPNESVFFGRNQPLAFEEDQKYQNPFELPAAKEQTSFVPPVAETSVDEGVDQKGAGSDTQTLEDGKDVAAAAAVSIVDTWKNAFEDDPKPVLNRFGATPYSLTFRKKGSDEKLELFYADVKGALNLIRTSRDQHPETHVEHPFVANLEKFLREAARKAQEEYEKNILRRQQQRELDLQMERRQQQRELDLQRERQQQQRFEL